MTLNGVIQKLSAFRDKTRLGNMEVVFHDVDGVACNAFTIEEDYTCNEDEHIIRIMLLDEEDDE